MTALALLFIIFVVIPLAAPVFGVDSRNLREPR
jgi:hypothetical protein